MPVAIPLTAAESYHELCAYTLAHGDPSFIHQHVVDAYAAQNADAHTKAITLTFALVGLHLHVDRGFSGKDVQRAHQKLAGRCRSWPSLPLPAARGATTAAEVIAVDAGPQRDAAIDHWCASVWEAYAPVHETVATLVREHGLA